MDPPKEPPVEPVEQKNPLEVPAQKQNFEEFKPPPKPPKPIDQLLSMDEEKRYDKFLEIIKATLRKQEKFPSEAVGLSEESAKKEFESSFNLDEVGAVAEFLAEMNEELEKGDSIAFARFGNRLYYNPKAFGNMYQRDPVKLAEAKKLEKKQDKKNKHTGQGKGKVEARLTRLEKLEEKRTTTDTRIEELQELCDRLIKRDKLAEFNIDRIDSMYTWVQGHEKQITVLEQQMKNIEAVMKVHLKDTVNT